LKDLVFNNSLKLRKIRRDKTLLLADKTVDNHPDLPDEKGKTFG
jgi:hypothetical protein